MTRWSLNYEYLRSIKVFSFLINKKKVNGKVNWIRSTFLFIYSSNKVFAESHTCIHKQSVITNTTGNQVDWNNIMVLPWHKEYKTKISERVSYDHCSIFFLLLLILVRACSYEENFLSDVVRQRSNGRNRWV
jgi:hypothetical protein